MNAAEMQEAVAAEFYPTPRECVDILFRGGGPELPGGLWLDPCAGESAIPLAVQAHRQDVRWLCVELRARCYKRLQRFGHHVMTADFLRCEVEAETATVVIMNSPFSATLAFVLRAFEVAPVAWVCSLQRQGWHATKGRAEWLSKHAPDRYTLPFRPSFTGDGATDSTEYEWYIWPPDGRNRRKGESMMLYHNQQLSLIGD